MTEEMLDVVDEDDNLIGVASRSDVHAKNLWHREVFILFVTPKGEIIFQRRSMRKATDPGLLAFTVGGHVVQGDTYEQGVLREAKEETGLDIDFTDLVFLKKDKVARPLNHCHRIFYGYVFDGSINDLQIEPEEGSGFVSIIGKNIFNLPEDMRTMIATSLLDPAIFGSIYEQVLALVK